MAPFPWYSSDMIRSRSSLLRSIPVYQAQLKRTAFRSFAPAAGVYSGPPPRPLPPPCPPPPPCSPPARPCAGACALAVGSAPIVRTVAIATCATTILFMMAAPCLVSILIVRIVAGGLDFVPVRKDHHPQGTQGSAILRRKELHFNGIPDVEGIRSGFADAPLREGRGGAQCQHPLGCRAIVVLDRDRKCPVGICELQFCYPPRQLFLVLHIIHAREGVMS